MPKPLPPPPPSRRVGFCLSSRPKEVTGFKSSLHRHPPTDPTTHTAFSASPTLPHSLPQTLSAPTTLSALPAHSTSSPPCLTAPTAPLPLSSLGRPCKCFRPKSSARCEFAVEKHCTTSLGTMAEIGCDPASLSTCTYLEFCFQRLLPALDSDLSAFGVGGTGGSP